MKPLEVKECEINFSNFSMIIYTFMNCFQIRNYACSSSIKK